MNITATGEVGYRAFASLETSRTLSTQTDASLYRIGDTATITAFLANGFTGLAGATVSVWLTRPDGLVDLMSLTDQGSGLYTADYVIPSSSGYLTIGVTASGSDGGMAFSRSTTVQAAIQSSAIQLTGVYAAVSNDDNADGLNEKINFTTEVKLFTAGEYMVTADLYADMELVAQVAASFNLNAGLQTITLPFNGVSIRKSMLNGPYTIKNLFLIPLDTGVIAQNAQDVFTTSSYTYDQFGSEPCYALTVSHTGSGANPLLFPASSIPCNPGEFVNGELITLSVAPTNGWNVGGWTGSMANQSTATTNTVSMPASSHSVSVDYIDITPPNVASILRADVSPTNAAIVNFTITFSEPVLSVDATDFYLNVTGITGASITEVVGSGNTYTVSVSTGSGAGEIRLDVLDDNFILNSVSNPLGGIGESNGDFTDGQSYTISSPTAVNLCFLLANFENHGVFVTWQTAIEVNLMGFNIYRAETESIEKQKLNSDLIIAKTPGGMLGNDYQFWDGTSEIGKSYNYWLEMVEVNRSQEYGPVFIKTLYELFLPKILNK